MELSPWINLSHGMELEPDINLGPRNNENGILFLNHWMLLKFATNTLSIEDIGIAEIIIKNIQTYDKNGKQIEGLYDRGAEESLVSSSRFVPSVDRRTISHDNLTAIVRLSKLMNLPYNKHIVKYGIKNLMRFDNCYPEKPRWSRIQHPRDYFFWLWEGGYKLLSLPFFPIFFFANIVTCFTPEQETSGKMLMFTRLFLNKSIPMKLTWWVCNKILKKKYKTENWLIPVTAIYFHQRQDNPIRFLAAQIEL